MFQKGGHARVSNWESHCTKVSVFRLVSFMIRAHFNKYSLVNPQYDPPLLTDAGGLF